MFINVVDFHSFDSCFILQVVTNSLRTPIFAAINESNFVVFMMFMEAFTASETWGRKQVESHRQTYSVYFRAIPESDAI